MRIAWFSPLPPHRSGTAAHSAEILSCLATHDIEAFVDDGAGVDEVSSRAPMAAVPVYGAHDFIWRHARRPYDVTVYHVAGDPCHDYLWPYLVRYPGLVALHDVRLDECRAQSLVRQRRMGDFRAEFAYAYPEAPPELADLIAAGRGGALCYLWPMIRIPVEAARVVGVHSAFLARELEEQFPGLAIQQIRLGVPDPLASPAASTVDVRRRHGIPDEAVVFGSFGPVTPDKGLTSVLRALAHVARAVPNIRLLVVGEAPSDLDLMARARDLGIAELVVQTGYVEAAALPAYLAAADVCLNLQWPTGREISATWIRCMAAGKPTVMRDLVHLTDVPSLDLRSMKVACTDPALRDPVCVRVELTDEVNMLRLALRRLAGDPALRLSLGRAARRYWADRATLELMAREYEEALERTRTAPAPGRPANWPAHLAADGTAAARALLARVGAPYPLQQFRQGSGRISCSIPV